MELDVLDPFGDYETRGYLRNVYEEKDRRVVGRLETRSFHRQLNQALRFLRRLPDLQYEHILEVHRLLFTDVYPWAGQDREQNAPGLAIVKAGYKNLFAYPNAVRRSADFALQLARDISFLRERPGHVFGYLAHSHPFLEGNGRTIMTVYADLCRRAGFYLRWDLIGKREFLQSLTDELLQPGVELDTLFYPYIRTGRLSLDKTAVQLRLRFKMPHEG